MDQFLFARNSAIREILIKDTRGFSYTRRQSPFRLAGTLAVVIHSAAAAFSASASSVINSTATVPAQSALSAVASATIVGRRTRTGIVSGSAASSLSASVSAFDEGASVLSSSALLAAVARMTKVAAVPMTVIGTLGATAETGGLLLIVSSDSSRTNLIVQNTGNAPVYLGGSGVTIANGLQLFPEETINLSGYTGELYGITDNAAGQVTVFALEPSVQEQGGANFTASTSFASSAVAQRATSFAGTVQSSLSIASIATRSAIANQAASAQMAALGRKILTQGSSLSASSSSTATATRQSLFSPAIYSGIGDLEATSTRERTNTLSFQAEGVLVADYEGLLDGAAIFDSSSLLGNNALLTRGGESLFTAEMALTVDGVVQTQNQVTLSASGSSLFSGNVVRSAASVLGASSQYSGYGASIYSLSFAPSAASSLVATAQTSFVVTAQASLNASASASSVGRMTRQATIQASGRGSLAALTTAQRRAIALLSASGTGNFAGGHISEKSGQSTLISQGTMNALARRTRGGAQNNQASGILVVDGVFIPFQEIEAALIRARSKAIDKAVRQRTREADRILYTHEDGIVYYVSSAIALDNNGYLLVYLIVTTDYITDTVTTQYVQLAALTPGQIAEWPQIVGIREDYLYR